MNLNSKKKKYIILLVGVIFCLVMCFLPYSISLQIFVNEENVQEEQEEPTLRQLLDLQQEILAVTYGSNESDMEEAERKIINNKSYFQFTLLEDKYNSFRCKTSSDYIGVNILWNGIKIHTLSGEEMGTYFDKQTTKYPQNEYFSEMTLDQALKKYVEQGYVLLLASNREFSKGISLETSEYLKSLGLQNAPADVKNSSDCFIAMITDGLAYSDISETACEYQKKMLGHECKISSVSEPKEEYYSEILIDGINYSLNERGINIVVYDLNTNKLIDILNFDTADDSHMNRNYDAFYKEHDIIISDAFFDAVSASVQLFLIFWKMFWITILVIYVAVWEKLTHIMSEKLKNYEYHMVTLTLKHFLLTVLICFALLLPLGYEYLKKNFDNVSLDQLIYHLNTDLGGTNWEDFAEIIEQLMYRLGMAIGLGMLLFGISLYLRKKQKNRKNIIIIWGMRSSLICICLFTISLSLNQFCTDYNAFSYLVSKQLKSTLYENYYVDASTAKIKFPEEKKNLIYIFLESMEITNADKTVGGGKEFNCITELTDMALNNECFNGDKNILNGGLTLGNTTWTVAAMVAQTAGVPLNLPIDGNSYDASHFLPGAYSIGDVLEDNGYQNVLLIGSKASFASRDTYFAEHGNYKICDYEWAKETKKIPEDYYVWWGYEDNKLFNYAKEKVLELASAEEPFNLTLLTVDTHFTDGHVCEDCQNEYLAQYANVMSCSSAKVTEFVNWIQEQDFYEDTVIVLCGDHYSMDGTYFSDLDDEYERKVYLSIINGNKDVLGEEREFCTMDMFPTTLSALGCEIEGNRLGLGTDLYSNEKTLVELLGKKNFSYQLGLSSNYYDKKILYASK